LNSWTFWLLTLSELQEHFRDAEIIYFGDSSVANNVAIRGTSKARDLSRLAFLVLSHLASLAPMIWVERATSERNPANSPSRKNFESSQSTRPSWPLVPCALKQFSRTFSLKFVLFKPLELPFVN
jgi:hypothetical protein